LSLPLYAASVSFMVIETGTGAKAAGNAAKQWEDGIMDAFFSAGHIISNAPMLYLSSYPQGEIPPAAKRDLSDAGAGFSDYFIIAFLNYDDTVPAGQSKPKSVSLRLYKVSPYRFLVEKSLSEKDGAALSGAETAKILAHKIMPFVGRGM
jgi:hypothetical protein